MGHPVKKHIIVIIMYGGDPCCHFIFRGLCGSPEPRVIPERRNMTKSKKNNGGQYGSSVPHMNVNFASVIHENIVILRAL